MSSFKPYVVGPKFDSPTLEKLKQERKNVPFVIVKYKSGNVSVWEREKGGRVRCVHGGLKQESEENAVVSSAFNVGAEVYYGTKQEAFMLCLQNDI